jgi:hypothetical protein
MAHAHLSETGLLKHHGFSLGKGDRKGKRGRFRRIPLFRLFRYSIFPGLWLARQRAGGVPKKAAAS